MNRALFTLMKLRLRGAGRKVARTMKRPKGALLVLLSVGLFALIVLPSLLAPQHAKFDGGRPWFLDAEALFGFWLVMMIMGRSAGTMVFTLPEVEFLFPGPFSRRELLAYKLALSSLAPLGTAVMMVLFLGRFSLWWPALALGVWLSFAFMQNTTLLLRLIVDWIMALPAGWRRLLAAFGVSLLAVGLWQARHALQQEMTWTQRLAIVESTWPSRAVLAPFEAFSRLLQAQTGAELALWLAMALAINAAVVVLILWSDTNFLEASLAASQKRYEMLQRARRGGGMPSIGVRSKPRLGLPRFPRLGGAGPIAWRQALDLLRNSARLLFVLPAVIAMGAPAVFVGPHGLTVSIVVLTFLVSFLISTVMPLGLRADLHHVEALKALPVRPALVVWGSIASAVLYPTIIQIAVLLLLTAISGQWPLASTLSACFVLPLNLLLVSVDSVLVLMYPSTRHFTAGDPLVGARMALVFMVKYLYLALAAIVPGLWVVAVDLALGDAIGVMAAGAWVAMVVEGALTIWLASWLFARFDPSLEDAVER
ncbi:MAG: putative ABC exporter domain-containing protein [Pirellulales bacterium]